jgi:hypothetical protein
LACSCLSSLEIFCFLCCKTLQSVAIMGHVLRSIVNSEAENDMEAEFLMTSNGGQVFVAMRNLLGDLRLVAAASASGGDNT